MIEEISIFLCIYKRSPLITLNTIWYYDYDLLYTFNKYSIYFVVWSLYFLLVWMKIITDYLCLFSLTIIL